MDVMMELYDRVVDKNLLIRRVNIAACNLIHEDGIISLSFIPELCFCPAYCKHAVA